LFDNNGLYARSGKINAELLETLLSHPYFFKARPKSTGQEQFGYDYYQKIKALYFPKNDDEWRMFIRSISEMTIRSIVQDIRSLKRDESYPIECVCSGGGANNVYIMERLQEELPECAVRRFDLPEIPADSKEAFGFAYLAYLFMRHIPGNVPSVTGSSQHCVLGKIVF
jgi:anhydro-N-acetylmuramic acid kinase